VANLVNSAKEYSEVNIMQQEKYDAVVIGSGIAGLCAGALLSRWGYKTLVVEKLSRIGGRCSTEEYEGFKLPTGAITIHSGGGMDETFRDVGVDLELVMVPRLLWRIEGKDYEMPAKGSVAAMLDIINKLEVERTKLVGGLAKAVAQEKIKEALGRGVREPEKETLTVQDWLLQYTDNELAHDIFDALCTWSIGHSYEGPAAYLFAWFIKMGGMREAGVPPRGNLAEMEKLAEVIKGNNGDVWTNCPAMRIVVERGRAKGVVVQKDGTEVEIASQVVISNAWPKRTVELAGERNFDEQYLRMMRQRFKLALINVAFVASDRPLWPESGEPTILMLTGTRRLRTFVPLSNIVPELAPPGQHLLYAAGRPRCTMVRVIKDEEERQISLDLEEQLPLFKKHGRILRLDARDIDSEWTDGGRVGFMMPNETPIKNLYNVGDLTCPFGLDGTTGAVAGARHVAESIKKLVKPGRA